MDEEPRIIFENEELMVLEKPAGLTVNRSDTTKDEETLQDWVEEKIKDQRSKIKAEERETDFYKRAGIVHRLDKETSGIILVAKTKTAFENLQGQFKERSVEKVYVALVHGEVAPRDGEINVPVGRLSWNRKRFGVVAGGREAVTKYHTLNILHKTLNKKEEVLTFLELYPKTGRTHQIRVHLKYFGHPIFSDHLYGGRKQARDDRKILPRVFLHAAKISFFDPKSGQKISFESKLPKNLHDFIS